MHLLLTAVAVACLAAPPPAPRRTGPQPLLVLWESSPWRMVIGSDTPTFAFYSDGRVIYQRHTRRRLPPGVSPYLSAVLGRAEWERLLASVTPAALRRLKD